MHFRILDRFQQWWKTRRGQARNLEVRAEDLAEGAEHDLLFLQQHRFVSARATGQSILQIQAEIQNLLARRLQVVIQPGTYFVAQGNSQNMVTRVRQTVTLHPSSTARITLDAACINASLPIPGDQDRFDGVRRVSADLARFLEASQNAHPMTVQAGVWALTDRYSAAQIRSHLIWVDSGGNRHQAVSEQNVAEARRILQELNIKSRL